MAVTSKAQAILHAKCPRCRRGNMFAGGMYNLGSNQMNESCPHCGFYFEIEPGYFYAAMYVSYALNVAESVAFCVATYVLTGNTTSPWLYLGAVLIGCLLLSPFNYRYARVLLLYWLSPKVYYHPELDTDDLRRNV